MKIDKLHTDEFAEQRLRTQIDGLYKDKLFYLIALNLSGKREQLEKLTTYVIDKYGYIKALKKSRCKK